MEDKKQGKENEVLLNIYPYSTEEKIISKLNLDQQVQKFTLSFKANDNYIPIFQILKNYLMKKSELEQLDLQLESLTNFDIEKSIYQLKELTQITKLSIQLFDYIIFNTFQSQTLGSFIQSFTNLVSLELYLSCRYLYDVDKFFELKETYSKLPNLKILKIQLYEFEESSTIIYAVTEGIRLLKNLEIFKFFIYYCIRSSYVIDALEQELKYIENLIQISFIFGWYSKLTYHDLWNIGNILKYHQKLEKLKINGYFSDKNKNIELTKLGESIKELKHLKRLKISIYGETQVNMIQLLDSISSMQSLEKVLLDFTFKELSSIDEDLKLIGQYLAKITKLVSFKVEFTYPSRASIQQILNLVNELKPLKYLEELIISVSSLETKSMQGVDIENFRIIVNSIKNFHFTVYEVRNEEASCLCGNLVLNAIKDSENLENLKYQIGTYYESIKNQEDLQIQELLKKKRGLKILDLLIGTQYHVKEHDFSNLVQELSQNPGLTKITLEFLCKIKYNYQMMKSLSNSITQLQQLTNLVLKFGPKNPIDNNGFQKLCESLQTLQKLEELNMTIFKDKLKPETLNSFISSLQNLKKMNNITLKIIGSDFHSDEEEQQFSNSFVFQPKMYFFNIEFQIPHLKYSNFETFFKSISQLKKLHYFYLVFTWLDVNLNQAIEIREYLSKLQSLKGMNFWGYSLNLIYLFNLLQDIQTLETIELQNQYRTDFSSQVIGKKKLKYVRDESYYHQYAQQEPYDKEKLKQTYSLKIQNDYFLSKNNYLEEISNIPFIFENITFLNKLRLFFNKDNKIGNNAAMELFKNISSLKQLRNLSVGISNGNQIGQGCLERLGQTLTELSLLKKFTIQINLSGNNINLEASNEFFEKLGSLKQLNYLEFSLNYDSSENVYYLNENYLPVQLFNSLQSLKSLKQMKLNLQNCTLSPENTSQLSLTFEQLKENLTVLEIYYSAFQNQILFMQSLLKLKNLQYLSLKSGLEDQSKRLYKLKRLTQIVFSENYEHLFFNL